MNEPTTPNGLERALAIRFAEHCPLPVGKRDELAQLLADYRAQLQATWKELAAIAAKRGV